LKTPGPRSTSAGSKRLLSCARRANHVAPADRMTADEADPEVVDVLRRIAAVAKLDET
jgi:hypothetical protein